MLRAAREKKGLALLDVEAATGLMGGGISHIENGRNIPSLMSAFILCKFYGLSLIKLAVAVAEDERGAVTTESKPVRSKPKRVGVYRRMRLKRQMKFKRRMDKERRKAHDDLAAYYGEKLGI
jgi:transcriptional regulator with XRE-family HTH domain